MFIQRFELFIASFLPLGLKDTSLASARYTHTHTHTRARAHIHNTMSQSKVDERDHYEGKFSEANVEEESNQSVHSSSDDGEDSGHEFELVDMVWDFANSSELADEFEEFIRDHFDELRDVPLNSEQN